MEPFSVYIHVPYCLSKCRYCDFSSYAGLLHSQAAYFGALKTEISRFAERYGRKAVDSIYFGGGTPSIVKADYIAETLALLSEKFELLPNCEISMEANPATLDEKKLSVYRGAGINRLSVGMQSSSDRLLSLLGRAHTHRQTIECVELIKAAGFENFNLDLMFGIPKQSESDFEASLCAAIALEPAHISAYSLIIEPDTPFYEIYGDNSLLDEELDRRQYHTATHLLSEAGFERYEISNFARAGKVCRHNKYCWDYAEYIGFGVAAHSFLENARFSNPTGIAEYIDFISRGQSAPQTLLSLAERREEFLMLGLRKAEGISLYEFSRRFGEELLCSKNQILLEMQSHKLIQIEHGRLLLTERGFDIANSIIVQII